MDSWEPWQSYSGNPVIFEGDPYMDELVKKQLILKPINKNRIKYANFDFGFRRLPRNVSYYRKRNNEK